MLAPIGIVSGEHYLYVVRIGRDIGARADAVPSREGSKGRFARAEVAAPDFPFPVGPGGNFVFADGSFNLLHVEGIRLCLEYHSVVPLCCNTVQVGPGA